MTLAPVRKKIYSATDVERDSDLLSAIAQPNLSSPQIEKLIFELKKLKDVLDGQETNKVSAHTQPAPQTEAPQQNLYKKKRAEAPPIKRNQYWGRFKNPSELFHLGLQFKKDIELKKKIFSFASLNDRANQHLSMLGISCFLNHQYGLRVLNLTYAEYENPLTVIEIEGEDKVIASDDALTVVSDCSGVALYDLAILDGLPLEKCSKALKQIMSAYDVVFIDIQSLTNIDHKASFYYYLIGESDSVTIVAEKKDTKFSQLENLLKVSANYGLEVKGVVWNEEVGGKNVKN